MGFKTNSNGVSQQIMETIGFWDEKTKTQLEGLAKLVEEKMVVKSFEFLEHQLSKQSRGGTLAQRVWEFERSVAE